MSGWIFAHQGIFLLTGVFQTIGAQWLYYQGAAHKATFLTVAALYLGMALVHFVVPPSFKFERQLPYKKIVLISALDFLGNVSVTAGLFLIGSGLFQVIYSSIVIFNAVLSKIFLNKKIALAQWFALLCIASGLAIGAFANTEFAADSSTLAGIGATLLGTVFFSCVYVLNETALKDVDSALSPEELCAKIGAMSLFFSLIYVVSYTIPNINELMIVPMENKQASITKVIVVYLSLVIASFYHSVSYFKLIDGIGAISTGILQALRAVSVFGLSAVLFCEKERSQCFNTYKSYSTLIVCLSVVAFSYAGRRK